MAQFFKLALPVDYYKKYLEQGVRPDGRELLKFRSTVVNTGSITTAEGSAFVSIGKMSVMCGIKAEFATPKTEEPDKGFIVPNVDLPALCSSQFKSGPPSEQAQRAGYFIQELIISSKCVLLEDLCIAKGKLCWVLYCDMVCLNYDGNLLDACTLALVAALRDVRLPSVTVSEETGLPAVDFTKKIALTVRCLPICTTFSIFENVSRLADPTSEEETLCSGSVTIVTVDSNQLCMVHQTGSCKLTDDTLQCCIKYALDRTDSVAQLISSAASIKISS